MLEKDQIIHLYNQGNNRRTIFYNRENYLFFLKKLRKHLPPFCEILCYCLMPNHLHVMINTNESTERMKWVRNKEISEFSENLRIMLNSYTTAINKQQNTFGSLFRQNTKLKRAMIMPLTNENNYICEFPVGLWEPGRHRILLKVLNIMR